MYTKTMIEAMQAIDDAVLDETPRDKPVHDIEAGKGVHHIELWYPGVHEPSSETVVEIGLCHVRAARDIRVHFDLERNGYVITAQDFDESASDETYDDAPWVEKGFVPA